MTWKNAAIALCLAVSQAALAQSWPTKPLRLLVPVPPGPSADLNARLLAPKLTEQLKQLVVIENRPGAAGIIAMGVTAKAPPDGTTALIAKGIGNSFASVPRNARGCGVYRIGERCFSL